jgi:hypothetical protein
MAVYNVKIMFNNTVRYEVEAPDEETACELGQERCQEEECPDDIFDAIVTLSDCQYTAQQELLDRERDL